jgi:hypothetical protein
MLPAPRCCPVRPARASTTPARPGRPPRRGLARIRACRARVARQHSTSAPWPTTAGASGRRRPDYYSGRLSGKAVAVHTLVQLVGDLRLIDSGAANDQAAVPDEVPLYPPGHGQQGDAALGGGGQLSRYSRTNVAQCGRPVTSFCDQRPIVRDVRWIPGRKTRRSVASCMAIDGWSDTVPP